MPTEYDEEPMTEEPAVPADDGIGSIRDLLADKLAGLLPEGADPDEIADALMADEDIQAALGIPPAEGGEEEPMPEEEPAEGEELPPEGEEPPAEEEPAPEEEPPAGGGMPFMPKRGESNAMRSFRAQFAK